MCSQFIHPHGTPTNTQSGNVLFIFKAYFKCKSLRIKKTMLKAKGNFLHFFPLEV